MYSALSLVIRGPKFLCRLLIVSVRGAQVTLTRGVSGEPSDLTKGGMHSLLCWESVMSSVCVGVYPMRARVGR